MDLIFLGLMAVLVVIGLVIGKLAGKKLGKAEFDERQQLARGKAYKAGFYTLLAGLLAVYLLPIFTEWQPPWRKTPPAGSPPLQYRAPAA